MTTIWHLHDLNYDLTLGIGAPASHGPTTRIAANVQGHTSEGVPVLLGVETLQLQWDHQSVNGGETPDMDLRVILKAGVARAGNQPLGGWALVTPLLDEVWTFGGGGGLDKLAQGSHEYDLGLMSLSGRGTARLMSAWLLTLEWVAGTDAGQVWARFGNRAGDHLAGVPTLG
jgi:hypothetical protein